jgi:hypothetical protein
MGRPESVKAAYVERTPSLDPMKLEALGDLGSIETSETLGRLRGSMVSPTCGAVWFGRVAHGSGQSLSDGFTFGEVKRMGS